MEALARPQSRDFGAVPIKSEGESRDNVRLDDLDDLPLTSRRKMLLAKKPHSGENCLRLGVREEERENYVASQLHVVVKTEETLSESEIQNILPLVSQTQSSTFDHSCDSNAESTKPEGEIHDIVCSDELDHIPLSTRKKMLLAMKAHSCGEQLETHTTGTECNGTPMPFTAVSIKKEDEFFYTRGISGGVSKNLTCLCIDKEAEQQREEICSMAGESSLIDKISTELSSCHRPDLTSNRTIVHRLPSVEVNLFPSEKICTKPSSCHEMDVMSSRSVVHSLPDVQVKIEPLDSTNLPHLDRNAVGNAVNMLRVQSEIQTLDKVNGESIDHMLLRDRLDLMRTGEDSALSFLKNSEFSEVKPTAVSCSTTILESVKPISIKRPRKRKRTATDSIETAMEEDAPGLLQVLLDKGITVNEIKLYGETENDDPLDESFSEDSFGNLEDVISKLYSQRQSLLRFAPLRGTKECSKATYCLACLFSLIEQTRYLQFKKWPVEWGWGRDLQSFIFVFQRHRRIVLERPEYGFATYFFELVDSLPIQWQIKRLVIAMKLTSCSRAILLENKVLSVGEDLSEGEARVLMEYGWIPNTGLGTMLNYYDRVVHDRKNIEDSSEWRSKIGKLLMDGYNGGERTIVDNVNECKMTEIKQELL